MLRVHFGKAWGASWGAQQQLMWRAHLSLSTLQLNTIEHNATQRMQRNTTQCTAHQGHCFLQILFAANMAFHQSIIACVLTQLYVFCIVLHYAAAFLFCMIAMRRGCPLVFSWFCSVMAVCRVLCCVFVLLPDDASAEPRRGVQAAGTLSSCTLLVISMQLQSFFDINSLQEIR